MAIVNDSRTLTILQDLVDRALAGAIAGQFFDLDDLPNFRNLTGDETAQNPGGVRALGGNDTLLGASNRSDFAIGNGGNDTLNGGSTAALLDVLRGGQGSDTITGSGILHGNRDNDFLTLSSGLARGGQGDDTLVGGGVLMGDFGADLLEGSLGAPTVFVLRSDTETGTQLETADLMVSFRPTAGHRIAVVGDFAVTDLSFEVATVVSASGRQRNLTAADGLADVLIRRTSTGQLLGVVVNFGDANAVRSLTEVVPFTDPALQLG